MGGISFLLLGFSFVTVLGIRPHLVHTHHTAYSKLRFEPQRSFVMSTTGQDELLLKYGRIYTLYQGLSQDTSYI